MSRTGIVLASTFITVLALPAVARAETAVETEKSEALPPSAVTRAEAWSGHTSSTNTSRSYQPRSSRIWGTAGSSTRM